MNLSKKFGFRGRLVRADGRVDAVLVSLGLDHFDGDVGIGTAMLGPFAFIEEFMLLDFGDIEAWNLNF